MADVSDAPDTQAPTPTPPAGDAAAAPQVGGIKRKNLILIGVVTLLVWAFAIQTGSVVLMSIVGVLTVALLAVMFWAFRVLRKQRGLASLIQGAASSPEARREAIAKLAADKDANEIPQLFARAQLVAADDPAGALKILEPIDIKKVPPQMQDDVAILRAQLYLHFGRTKEARPLADLINPDNPQRKEMRGMIVGVVGEAWARTGKPAEALTLLDTVKPSSQQDQVKIQLLVARIFGLFASGKKQAARDELTALADIDVNHLGRFLMPQFRVHPELQKLARAVAERHPQMRKLAKQQQRGRGKPR